MQFTQNDTDNLFELLQWRRDVRNFQTTQLSSQDIQQLLRAMELAPSVGNSRPWRVIAVKSASIRKQIIENHGKANKDASKNYDEKIAREYQSLKLAGLQEAPLQLAIFTDLNPLEGRELGRKTMPETLTYSTVVAIHQLWLVARTLNIGVGWVSILNPKQINETLDVDLNWKFTAYLCIGYPQQNSETPELHKNGWQENTPTTWLER